MARQLLVSCTNDFGLAWAHEDYLKADEQQGIRAVHHHLRPSRSVHRRQVALYWRVVAKNAGAAATLTLPAAKKDDKDKDKDKDKKPPSKYAYENITYITPGDATARLSRAVYRRLPARTTST